MENLSAEKLAEFKAAFENEVKNRLELVFNKWQKLA